MRHVLTSETSTSTLCARGEASASLAGNRRRQLKIGTIDSADELPWDGRYSHSPTAARLQKSIQLLRPGANLLSGGRFGQLGRLCSSAGKNGGHADARRLY